MSLLMIALGVVLLLAGRRLFWFAVGAMGFVTGIWFARTELGLDDSNAALLVALLAGIAGMLLAVLVQKLAIALVGFLAGGYVSATVLVQAGATQDWQLLGYVLGGLIGALMMASFFEWALVPLTAAVGSLILVKETGVQPPMDLVMFAVLAVVGGIAQWRGERPRRVHRARRRQHHRQEEAHA